RQGVRRGLANQGLEQAERTALRSLRLQLLRDDERKGDLRLILMRLIVDDAYFLTGANRLSDLQQGHVTATLGVVELPVGVALDHTPYRRRVLTRQLGAWRFMQCRADDQQRLR